MDSELRCRDERFSTSQRARSAVGQAVAERRGARTAYRGFSTDGHVRTNVGAGATRGMIQLFDLGRGDEPHKRSIR